jgi:hypothetical protein
MRSAATAGQAAVNADSIIADTDLSGGYSTVPGPCHKSWEARLPA